MLAFCGDDSTNIMTVGSRLIAPALISQLPSCYAIFNNHSFDNSAMTSLLLNVAVNFDRATT